MVFGVGKSDDLESVVQCSNPREPLAMLDVD